MWRSRLPILVNRKMEREQRKITQKEIADCTGIRQPTISAWMNYDRRFVSIDVNVAEPLARWLGCDPIDLFEFVPEQSAVVHA